VNLANDSRAFWPSESVPISCIRMSPFSRNLAPVAKIVSLSPTSITLSRES